MGWTLTACESHDPGELFKFLTISFLFWKVNITVSHKVISVNVKLNIAQITFGIIRYSINLNFFSNGFFSINWFYQVIFFYLLRISALGNYNVHFILFYKRFYLLIFTEGKGGRKCGRETSMCGCLLCVPTGALVRNPGMFPDWESNWPPFGSQAGTQSTEPHQPGPTVFLLDKIHDFSLLQILLWSVTGLEASSEQLIA